MRKRYKNKVTEFKSKSSARNFREKMGLTCNDVISFCRIPLSTLSMYEAGKREIPFDHLEPFNTLQIASLKAEKETEIPPYTNAPQDGSTKRKLEKEQFVCLKRVRALEDRLQEMSSEWDALCHLHRSCLLLAPSFPDPESLQARYIKLWQDMVSLHTEDCNPKQQDYLKLQLEAERKKLAFLNEWVGVE